MKIDMDFHSARITKEKHYETIVLIVRTNNGAVTIQNALRHDLI